MIHGRWLVVDVDNNKMRRGFKYKMEKDGN